MKVLVFIFSLIASNIAFSQDNECRFLLNSIYEYQKSYSTITIDSIDSYISTIGNRITGNEFLFNDLMMEEDSLQNTNTISAKALLDRDTIIYKMVFKKSDSDEYNLTNHIKSSIMINDWVISDSLPTLNCIYDRKRYIANRYSLRRDFFYNEKDSNSYFILTCDSYGCDSRYCLGRNSIIINRYLGVYYLFVISSNFNPIDELGITSPLFNIKEGILFPAMELKDELCRDVYEAELYFISIKNGKFDIQDDFSKKMILNINSTKGTSCILIKK